MKKIAIAVLCIFCITCTYAQKRSKGVVYLKNGTVLKGELISVGDEKLVVQSHRNTFVFNQAEVDSIVSKRMDRSLERIDKPWHLETSIGLLAGDSDNAKSAPFSLMGTFNHKVYDRLYAGAGVGIEFWEESYLPVFANFNYVFRESNFTPFLGLQLGYMIPLDDDQGSNLYYDYNPASSYWPGGYVSSYNPEGGWMINPSLGLRGMFHENLGWKVSIGYRHQQLNFDGDNENSLERNYNRLSVRVGIIFN